MSVKKATFRDMDECDDIPDSHIINDYKDGFVIVDFFSRHNTLEEYMELLSEASKKVRK
jgi:hypothetical protein